MDIYQLQRMYEQLRPLLFKVFKRDPEKAHFIGLLTLYILQRHMRSIFIKQKIDLRRLKVDAFGKEFAHPVGLAGGFLKDANTYIIQALLEMIGFSFVEVGTITPRPQRGHPRPRIHRIVEEEALINRMGFPNEGLVYAVNQLIKLQVHGGVVGANIGPNEDDAKKLQTTIKAMVECLIALYPLVDYITVNISSPNTHGLRANGVADPFAELMKIVMQERDRLAAQYNFIVPVLAKFSPDLDDDEVKHSALTLLANKVDGVIATNTALWRPKTGHSLHAKAGGYSGPLLQQRSLEIIGQLYQELNGAIPVVGVGGVNPDTIVTTMEHGATLVQLYTAFVYWGPIVVYEMLKRLNEHIENTKGIETVQDLVGWKFK